MKNKYPKLNKLAFGSLDRYFNMIVYPVFLILFWGQLLFASSGFLTAFLSSSCIAFAVHSLRVNKVWSVIMSYDKEDLRGICEHLDSFSMKYADHPAIKSGAHSKLEVPQLMLQLSRMLSKRPYVQGRDLMMLRTNIFQTIIAIRSRLSRLDKRYS